jgi:DNA polymerase I-like protein with 3'-5' exonuclease and polymerase domains
MRRERFNLARLAEYPVVCIDTETTGLNWRKDKMFGVAIAAFTDEKYDTMVSGYYDVRDQPRILEVLHDRLPHVRRYVNHNAKFDVHVLHTATGAGPGYGRVECTGVRAALINEHLAEYNLDFLGQKYVGRGKELSIYAELAQLFGGKADRSQIKNLHRAPAETSAKYAIPDAEVALQLWAWQEKEIEKQGLQQVWELERELTSVLIEIERGGVRVDADLAHAKLKGIKPAMDKALIELLKLAGAGYDEKLINSPKQMRALFQTGEEDGRWSLGLRDGRRVPLVVTEAGNPSIDADVLRLLAEAHADPRAQQIMRLKKLDKARQFLENHVLGHMEGDRVFPNMNQAKTERGTGTTTGRFSIEDPALQQIPARDKEMAEIVRSCFIPDQGEKWLSMDYKQFEARIFAHYVNDYGLNEAYASDPDTDFHQIVADMTGLPRSPRFAGDANAKQINLGLLFGMGKGKLAAEMGLPFTTQTRIMNGENKEVFIAGPEAEAIFDQYHSAVPGIKNLLSQASSIAKSRGYVQTMMGRHLRFPGGKFTHKAGGLVFQGTAADCMKYKMIEMWKQSKKWGVRMLLSVHDELNFSVARPTTGLTDQLVSCYTRYDGPIKFRVPITCSAAYGKDWYAASK